MKKNITKPIVSAIIVTHNSQRFIGKAIDCLRAQTRPVDRIVIVDSGSSGTDYLIPYQQDPTITIVVNADDVGFCRGNNVGMGHIQRGSDYVVLVNPDAFLKPDFIEGSLAYMEEPANKQVAMLTGALLGYDINADKPTGRYDSTGVFRTWYGRWYDRNQAEDLTVRHYHQPEELPAICGALMFCRKKSLDEVMIRGNEIFDSTFYMYKEDIDLSIRLRRADWKLMLLPALECYHCRGWNPDRTKIPRKYRLCSARNDIRIHTRMRSPCILYSMMKYVAVKCFDL